jgi:hypothetical protein
MKNTARLALFFSVSFIVFFLLFALIRFLNLRIEAIRVVPVPPGIGFGEALSAVQRALPAALYFSILLSLSYTARRKIPGPLSIIGLWALALAFTLALSLGLDRAAKLPPLLVQGEVKSMGKPGLILSQADTAMVLLRDPGEIRGSRVVSIQDRPLVYQEVPLGPNNPVLRLPPLPFRNEAVYFMNSLFIDFSLTAGQFTGRLEEGLIPFIIYTASLIFLLVSLRFIMDLGNWPLASLFLGALVFRGILALETFLNSREIQALLNSLLEGRIPGPLRTPLVFCGLGFLILLYTLLAHLAGGRRNQDD